MLFEAIFRNAVIKRLLFSVLTSLVRSKALKNKCRQVLGHSLSRKFNKGPQKQDHKQDCYFWPHWLTFYKTLTKTTLQDLSLKQFCHHSHNPYSCGLATQGAPHPQPQKKPCSQQGNARLEKAKKRRVLWWQVTRNVRSKTKIHST